MSTTKPRILFIDDELTSFDPGDFNEEGRPVSGAGEQAESYGVMGYYVRELRKKYDIDEAPTLDVAFTLFEGSVYDLILLDVMMKVDPNVMDRFSGNSAGGLRTGFVIAEYLHHVSPQTPILLLSNLLPGEGSEINKNTVADLVKREIVKGHCLKLDTDPEKLVSKVSELLGVRHAN